MIGCGGWSLPLLALSYAVVDGDVPRTGYARTG